MGDYLADFEEEFEACYPDRDGVKVTVKREELQAKLGGFDQYQQGGSLKVGSISLKIAKVITIDGRKINILRWLLVDDSAFRNRTEGDV